MKKLFLLLAICAFSLGVKAQELSPYDKYVSYTESWFTFTQPSGTYAHTATDSIWYYTVLKESYFPVKYDIKVTLHKVSGTTRVTPVILRAKKFESDAWTTLTTVRWSTGVDTTKRFTETSTYQQYRYFQIGLTAPVRGTVITIPELSAKFWQ